MSEIDTDLIEDPADIDPADVDWQATAEYMQKVIDELAADNRNLRRFRGQVATAVERWRCCGPADLNSSHAALIVIGGALAPVDTRGGSEPAGSHR